ncbi:MAG: YqgE/AlgH family protein [Bdellovibrionales bacterium]
MLKHAGKKHKKPETPLASQITLSIALGIVLAIIPFALLRNGYTGRVLVADERIKPPFDKALIYLDAHSIEGTTGIILNKPLGDAQKSNLSAFIRNADIPVGYGGPMGLYDKLLVLHEKKPGTEETPPEYELMDWDQAVRQTPDLIKKMQDEQSKGESHYRIFTGYTSWRSFQLEMEYVFRGDWYVVPASHNLMFQTGNDVQWDAIVKQEKARTAAEAK